MKAPSLPPAPWDTPEGRVTVTWDDLVQGYLAVRGAEVVAAKWQRGKFVVYVKPKSQQGGADETR